MLHRVQGILDLRISESVGNCEGPLEAEYSRKCILAVGPGLGMPACDGSDKHLPSYFIKLLDEIVAWCIREEIIIQPPVIEALRRLTREGLWGQASYIIEEYLLDKPQQQRCLKSILLQQTQPTETHRILARLPFLGYITTTYDTFLETAYAEARQGTLTKFYSSTISGAFKACKSSQPFILKLYGDVDDPNSLILSSRFSRGVMSNAREQLRTLLSLAPILFIGFEPGDPDFELLKGMVDGYDCQYSGAHRAVIPQETFPGSEKDESEVILQGLGRDFSEVTALTALPETVYDTKFYAAQVYTDPQYVPQLQPPPSSRTPITIFLAYTRKDARLCDQLELWLAMLRDQWSLNIAWEKGEITELWKVGIADPLNAFDLILLLFSPDFISSGFCNSPEMARAVCRHQMGAWVSPVLLRPCIWNENLFGRLAFLPDKQHFVTRCANRDDAYMSIAKGIAYAVQYLEARRPW